METYKPTGTKLAAPVAAPSTGRGRRGRTSAERVYTGAKKAPSEALTIDDAPRVLREPPKDPRKERLYILIEDSSDTETLSAIRRLADLNLGFQDVILVIKDGETKRPLKMPFKVDVTEELLKNLRELVGEEKVKVN